MNTWKMRFARLITIPQPDPDLARRGRLLNILLLGLAALIGVGLVGTLVTGVTEDAAPLLIISPLSEVAIAGLYFLNRRSPRGAAWLFLIGLLIAITFSDNPQAIFAGRTTALLVVPIFASSMLLFAAASFGMATLVSAVLLGLALAFHLQDAASLVFTGGILILTALVSWLTANSLETVLADLRRTEERTRSILDSITDGVLALEVAEEARIVAANPAAAQILQRIAPADLVGRSLAEVFSEADPEDWLIIRSTLQQESAIAEWPIQIGRVVLTATVVPLRAARPHTVRRRMLLTLRNSTREAEAQRLQAEFSMLLTQGLQTPLGIIEVLGEDVLDSKRTATAKQASAVALLDQARQLKRIVSDLIDRDQLSRRRLEVKLGQVSLPNCLTEIEQSVRPQAAAQQVKVTVKYLPLSPDRVTTDMRLLVQAGRNLVYHLLSQTRAEEIIVRAGRQDLTHWLLQVTDYRPEKLPYGPLSAEAQRVTPEPTLNWLLAEQVTAALHGEVQVGRNDVGQTLIQVVFDGLGASTA